MSPAVFEPSFTELLARPVVRRIGAACRGTPCHLVGGAIRDHALGQAPRDLDVVVQHHGRRIAEALAASLPARLVELGGDRFAAFRLVAGDLEIDLWDRGDASLEADLTRRDLTINSCAIDLTSGALVDPLGGLVDLASGLLRASSPRAFELDPLRVLRLPRLLAGLEGFAVERKTGVLAARAAAGLTDVAVERVRVELELLFASEGFSAAVPWLIDLRLYPGLWLGQPGQALAPASYPAAAARLEGLLIRVRDLAPGPLVGSATSAAELDRRAARFAIAFHHLPASLAHPGQRRLETEAVGRSRRAGLLRRPVAAAISRLLGGPEALGTEPDRRWFLHRLGPLWREGVCCRGALEGAEPTSPGWISTVTELSTLR